MIHVSALDCDNGVIRYRKNSLTTDKGENVNTFDITFEVMGQPMIITIHSKKEFVIIEDKTIF